MSDMSKPYHETLHKISDLGIQLAFNTVPGGFCPLHWHEELEILYPLNGTLEIGTEGEIFEVPKKHVTIIGSRQVHSSQISRPANMFLCIHVSPHLVRSYEPDIEWRPFRCRPAEIDDAQFPAYRSICERLETLTRLYMEEPALFRMEAEGLVLQILARLIRYFSSAAPLAISQTSPLARERLRELITYVEEHFREPLSSREAAERMGLGIEPFCRFFKKNMGISFLQYVSEVRAAHIYQDLVRTDLPIAELAEKNGFVNQKLFNRTFKKMYRKTPSMVRKQPQEDSADDFFNF